MEERSVGRVAAVGKQRASLRYRLAPMLAVHYQRPQSDCDNVEGSRSMLHFGRLPARKRRFEDCAPSHVASFDVNARCQTARDCQGTKTAQVLHFTRRDMVSKARP